jgi:hypothetical protein
VQPAGWSGRMQGKARPVSNGRLTRFHHSGAFLLTLRQLLCRKLRCP